MSKEIEPAISGFTVDSVHAELLRLLDDLERQLQRRFEASQKALDDALAYADQLRAEVDHRYEDRFVAQEKAVAKAESAAEKRFDAVNEFRSNLADQAATFIPRAEAEQRIGSALALIQALQQAASNQLTREESDRIGRVYSDKIDVLSGRLAELALDGRSYATHNELSVFRDQLSDTRESMMPRQEAKLLIDTLGGQIGTAQRIMNDLQGNVIQLRAALQGQGDGESEATEAAQRTRTTIFAVIGSVVALLTVTIAVFSLVLGLRTHTTSPPTDTPAVTTPASKTSVATVP